MASTHSTTPKYPSTLSSNIPSYVSGLVDRLRETFIPVLTPFFDPPPPQEEPRLVLELSSGVGVHAALYAGTWEGVVVQPTECDKYGCEAIDETSRKEGVEENKEGLGGGRGGVRKALRLDVLDQGDWDGLANSLRERGKTFDLVIGSNFLHMIPFPTGPQAIFSHLLPLTKETSKLLFYGPFKTDEGFASKADEEFDASIRSRPGGDYFGLRSVDALDRLAKEAGWELQEKISMPKVNWILVFGRRKA